MVVIEELSKQYGSLRVLRNINLTMETGLFGLLGPNGAGKTTLLRTLCTLEPIERGRVSICGFDLKQEGHAIRKRLGYLPQHFQVPGSLTGEEILHYMATLKGIKNKQDRNKQVARVLEEVNLTAKARQKVRKYSGGMLRRLGIAQAILGNPSLLIVDEPTAGLDPTERIRFRTLIDRLSKDRLIILSTHIISDIEAGCEQVAVLHRGSVAFNGSVADLRNIATNRVWEVTVPFTEYEKHLRTWKVTASRQEKNMAVLRVIGDKPPVSNAKPLEPGMEDGYLITVKSDTDY
ncbi:ATP-binding cassette domain-containing protein [Marininema halotolerans]|uniref:ABC-2 type transport system ATP-binding protein n=1 Tax=Marininema halotolerans TaxID=1155944 RepID=A0A1I6NUA5_9BACL|nr:ATP-binding cassette domain-containing protein [Marininema halotolerans]SFS31438.1 ABC-2 type transport system ATP-binding protein [Marininema halotolerans]